LVIKVNLLKTSSRLRRALIKVSITWDHPCYLYTINTIYHMHVSTLMTLAKS